MSGVASVYLVQEGVVAMASENELKPCPFCGSSPISTNEVVWCGNEDCSFAGDVEFAAWNRRATPPGAVEGWVTPSHLQALVESDRDWLIIGRSFVKEGDIPVYIVPREVTE